MGDSNACPRAQLPTRLFNRAGEHTSSTYIGKYLVKLSVCGGPVFVQRCSDA